MSLYCCVQTPDDELVVQYGYVTLFAVSCPLVSLLATLSNLVAIRSQSYKLCQLYQRPMLSPIVHGRGMRYWNTALYLMVYASVVTNCALVCFSMNSVQEWVPDQLHRVLLFFAVEHVILALGYVVHSVTPRTPQQVVDEHARQQHQNSIKDQHEQLGMHTLDPDRVELCQEPWQSF